MKRTHVFDLYKGEKFLATGTIKELSEKTKICPSMIYRAKDEYCSYRLVLKGQYVVIYEVYNEQGVICRGTKKECAERANMSINSVCKCAQLTRNGKLTGKNGGYMVRKIGVEFRKEGA